MNPSCWVLILVSVLCFLPFLDGWRIFHQGRMVGGNLGQPRSQRRKNSLINEGKSAAVSEEWFTQFLDHFTPTDGRTWQQRYFSNEEFFKSDAVAPVVFLMIGGEGTASDKWMTQGTWVEYGKKFGALLFQVEHRFYGKSRPTENMNTTNLKYLTSQQALADLATFIVAMNEKYHLSTTGVKWIAFGGSYPGSLAAWLRSKYPHLVHGAVSSSGPLLAQVDFTGYFKVVAESLATHSEECVSSVKDGMDQVSILLKQPIGQDNLNLLFKLCDPIQDSLDNPEDISNFYEAIADNFAGVVQYNKDNRIGSSKGRNITIDVVCDIMVNQDIGPAINRLATVNKLLLNTYDQKCLDYKYQTMIDTLKNVSWASKASEGARQWMYQTCTEFGFYQTSSGEPHVFGTAFPVNFFIDQCSDIFGPEIGQASALDMAVERTNTLYGGLGIEVTNVVFVHGSIDPWHALGITKTLDQNAPAIYIQGTAHCANLYPKSESDPPQLSAARVQIESLIDTWLRS